jgi:hypothetical protein
MNSKIILDSGATDHMTGRKEWFTQFQSLESPISILITDGSTIQATGRGSARLTVLNGQKWTTVRWEDVLYAPDLGDTSLMSCTQLVEKGYKIVMEKDKTECVMTVLTQDKETLFDVPDIH